MTSKPLFVIKNTPKTKIVGLNNEAAVILGAPNEVKPVFYDSKFSAKHAAKLMNFEEALIVEPVAA